MSPASCRLFVIVARPSAKAVILRRGPSKWCQLISWDMKDDAFLDGSWFHGRIYEEKCDLSPNGALFVYSAFMVITVGDQRVGSYTAVSRPPYLHALAIWPQDSTYGGGGRFLDDGHLALRRVFGDPFPALPRQLKIVDGPTDMHQSAGEVEGADWSGRDHRDRIIYTIGGRLFRMEKLEDGETDAIDYPKKRCVWLG